MFSASDGPHARHVREQRRRRGVDLDAHAVHAALHHLVEPALELRLVDVVLVLPDADGLRVDLHQLGERVLQAPRDAHRAAQRHVEARELVAREVARRVDRRAALVHHHHLGAHAARRERVARRGRGERLAHELLGLARRGAVADGDELGAVPRDEPHERRGEALGWCRYHVSVSTTAPVRDTAATFTPVRKPGSSPTTARPPAGAARSSCSRFCPKMRIASSSARVLSSRRSST
jgi:hypothetical protein